MRCLLLLALGSLLGPAVVRAQYAGVAPQSVYLELGGFGGVYSLNYDRVLPTGMVMRVGATRGTLCNWMGECYSTTALPLGMSYLIGNPLVAPSQWVEVGAGVVVGFKGEAPNTGVDVDTKTFVTLAAMLALRRQPLGRGLTYRLAFTPLLTLGTSGGVPEDGASLSAGIAVGYAF